MDNGAPNSVETYHPQQQPTPRNTFIPNRYLDVMAVPKRHVLEQLSLLAGSEEEKEKLLELASPEGADLYHEVCR